MPEDEIDFDDYEDECWQCGGEGFVASCFDEISCMYPEDGCDLCLRRCDVCRPRPASGIEARSDETPQAARPEGREPDPKGDAQ